MKEIILDQVKEYLEKNLDDFNIVFSNLKDVSDCIKYEEDLTEILMPKLTKAHWYKVYVTEPPTFAPPMLPCLTLFKGKDRVAEAGGLVADINNLNQWLQQAVKIVEEDNPETAPTTLAGVAY